MVNGLINHDLIKCSLLKTQSTDLRGLWQRTFIYRVRGKPKSVGTESSVLRILSSLVAFLL